MHHEIPLLLPATALDEINARFLSATGSRREEVELTSFMAFVFPAELSAISYDRYRKI